MSMLPTVPLTRKDQTVPTLTLLVLNSALALSPCTSTVDEHTETNYRRLADRARSRKHHL
jgi:hypothetical protein